MHPVETFGEDWYQFGDLGFTPEDGAKHVELIPVVSVGE